MHDTKAETWYLGNSTDSRSACLAHLFAAHHMTLPLHRVLCTTHHQLLLFSSASCLGHRPVGLHMYPMHWGIKLSAVVIADRVLYCLTILEQVFMSYASCDHVCFACITHVSHLFGFGKGRIQMAGCGLLWLYKHYVGMGSNPTVDTVDSLFVWWHVLTP